MDLDWPIHEMVSFQQAADVPGNKKRYQTKIIFKQTFMKTSKIVSHSIVTLASIFTLYVIYNTNPVFSAKLFQELRNLSLNTYLTIVSIVGISVSGIVFIFENFKSDDKISNYTLFICTILSVIFIFNLFWLQSILLIFEILGAILIFLVWIFSMYKIFFYEKSDLK